MYFNVYCPIDYNNLAVGDHAKYVATQVCEEHSLSNLFDSFGIRPSSLVLILGSTGTGKTSLAHSIAYKLNWSITTIETLSLVGNPMLSNSARTTSPKEGRPGGVILYEDVHLAVEAASWSALETISSPTLGGITVLTTKRLSPFLEALPIDWFVNLDKPSFDAVYKVIQQQFKRAGAEPESLDTVLFPDDPSLHSWNFQTATAFANMAYRFSITWKTAPTIPKGVLFKAYKNVSYMQKMFEKTS